MTNAIPALPPDPLVDAAGTRHALAGPGARVVSLVPSITELLCDLGLAAGDGAGGGAAPGAAAGARIVGRTGFCIHPRQAVREIAKVGGTKDVNLARVRELAPTHVVVNVDENTRETAVALAAFVPHVIVTHPLGPLDNLALYRLLGGIFGREEAAERLCAELEREVAALEAATAARAAAGAAPEAVLYLIWRDPWMAVAPETYIARTLALAGLCTLPDEAEAAALAQAAGASRDAARYPAIDPAAFAGRVSQVLLSSEPYHFREQHAAEVAALVPGARVRRVDGEMTSWYGSRAIDGLRYLGGFAHA